jgi:hypothetical protein
MTYKVLFSKVHIEMPLTLSVGHGKSEGARGLVTSTNDLASDVWDHVDALYASPEFASLPLFLFGCVERYSHPFFNFF